MLVFHFQCSVYLHLSMYFPTYCLQDHINTAYDLMWSRTLSPQQIEAAKLVFDEYQGAFQPIYFVCALHEYLCMGYRNDSDLFQIKAFREDIILETGNGCKNLLLLTATVNCMTFAASTKSSLQAPATQH